MIITISIIIANIIVVKYGDNGVGRSVVVTDGKRGLAMVATLFEMVAANNYNHNNELLSSTSVIGVSLLFCVVIEASQPASQLEARDERQYSQATFHLIH